MVKHTIDHYISNLLYYNECVVVPGFGAFLTRYYPAEINSATHMFRPPSKRVAFNTRIQENDGLLAKHISTVDQVSYEKAMESVDISVRSWKKLLRAGKKVYLNGIGRLYMSETGKLQFNPAHDINYDINSYGLNIFRANAMDRDLEIKRSVNKAIEKHQSKKGQKQVPKKVETTVVRDINYRRWVSLLGPVAAMFLVGAYLYTNPGTASTAQQQVSGIFFNDTSLKIGETADLSNLTASESAIGFTDGPRLNGDFGPEDDVISEKQEEEGLASEQSETNLSSESLDSPAVDMAEVVEDSDADNSDAFAFEEDLMPSSSDNAISFEKQENDLELERSNNRASAKEMLEEDFFIPERPLYNVKQRPSGYTEDSKTDDINSGYTFSSDLNTSAAPKQAKKEALANRFAKSQNTESEIIEKKIVAKPVNKPAASKQVSTSTATSTSQNSSRINEKVASAKPLTTGENYQVIVGAFSSGANANNYVNKLKGNGWMAYSYKSGSLHRVAIGNLNDREKADRLLTQVKQQVNAQAWVNLQ